MDEVQKCSNSELVHYCVKGKSNIPPIVKSLIQALEVKVKQSL
jgi:hypothetical protein